MLHVTLSWGPLVYLMSPCREVGWPLAGTLGLWLDWILEKELCIRTILCIRDTSFHLEVVRMGVHLDTQKSES